MRGVTPTEYEKWKVLRPKKTKKKNHSGREGVRGEREKKKTETTRKEKRKGRRKGREEKEEVLHSEQTRRRRTWNCATRGMFSSTPVHFMPKSLGA